MTFSVTIGSKEFDEDYLDVFRMDYMENDDEIKLMITTTREQDDPEGGSYTVDEGQAIVVNYKELLRAIEAVAILPNTKYTTE